MAINESKVYIIKFRYAGYPLPLQLIFPPQKREGEILSENPKIHKQSPRQRGTCEKEPGSARKNRRIVEGFGREGRTTIPTPFGVPKSRVWFELVLTHGPKGIYHETTLLLKTMNYP